MCQVSCVICKVSGVNCQVSGRLENDGKRWHRQTDRHHHQHYNVYTDLTKGQIQR